MSDTRDSGLHLGCLCRRGTERDDRTEAEDSQLRALNIDDTACVVRANDQRAVAQSAKFSSREDPVVCALRI